MGGRTEVHEGFVRHEKTKPQRSGCLLLAVAAPGSKELHQPGLVAVQHQVVEVVVGQLHHVLLTPATAAASALKTHSGRGALHNGARSVHSHTPCDRSSAAVEMRALAPGPAECGCEGAEEGGP